MIDIWLRWAGTLEDGRLGFCQNNNAGDMYVIIPV
jgi:hypothetical protein